jgi:phage host-nuclease inhibitor protein Gam
MTDYILQEEDDLQQTIRQLVISQVKIELKRLVLRLENHKLEVSNEYTQGVADGLTTAVNILRREIAQ